MAESISDLYFRLGLDTSDFQSGFIDAQQTLSQNLQALNRQDNLIQLKTQIDLTGLDEAELTTEGLRIQQEALTRQFEIQQDRIQLATAAYQEMVQAQGENSQAAYNMAMQLEQERLAMAKLQSQYQAISNQDNIALGVNWEMLGAIEPLLKVTEVAARGRESLTLLGRAIPVPQIKMGLAALVGLSAVIAGTAEATDELAESNAAQIFSGNIQNASAGIGTSFAAIQNSAVNTANVLNTSFKTASHTATQQLQEQESTFSDWARDFFRIAALMADDSDNFADAIGKVNSQSQFMRTELGEYAVITAGIFQTWKAVAKSAMTFVEPAIDGFIELKQHSDELNISLSKTMDFQALLDLAGAEYNDARDYVRGVQDAVIKGDAEDPEVIALEKYGISIQNANGTLLSFDETLENLYQGYLKAKAAGEEEAYVIMTNGQAVQDILPFFERLAKAKEDYAKISWSTSDFAALEETANSLKLLEIQHNEFDSSLQSLGLPLANYFAQADFRFYKKLTELVEENREEVLEWEFVVIEALKRVEDTAASLFDSLTGKEKETENAFERLAKKMATTFTGKKIYSLVDLSEYRKNFFDFIDEAEKDSDRLTALLSQNYQAQTKGIDDYSKYYQEYMSSWSRLKEESLRDSNRLTALLPESYQAQTKGIDFTPKVSNTIFDDAKKDVEEYIDANEKAREETEKTAEEISAGLGYSYNRIAKYKEELANIEIELKFGDDDYAKSLAQLDVWYDTVMRDAKYYAEEQSHINELYNAKAEQIEKNRLEKIEELRNQYSSSRQTDLAKQLADLDREMDSWIKSGMNSDDALEITERRKNEVVSKLKEEFAASTNSIHKSELESRLAQIETEKQAWIQKGIDEVEATRAAEQQKANARRELENSFSETVNALNQTDIERRISEIERESKSWIDKGIDSARAMRFAEAQEVEAIKQLNDEWVQHVNSIHQTALENRLAQIDEEKKAWIQKGIDEVKATQDAEQQKVDARRNAAMEIIKSQLEEFQIYQQGGYKALKAYKLHDLIETTGVDPNLLNSLTPQQVEEFQKAQLTAERSLLPNFMTEQDKAYNAGLLQNQQISELERILGGMSINGETPNIDISAGLNEGLTVFSTNIDAASSELSNLSQPISDFSTNVGTASEGLYSLSNEGLSVFSSNIETASDGLFDLSQPILDVTEKLQDLSGIVYELSNVPSNQNNNQSNTTSPTVNVTVQIEEAHAWDTEHIQALADKVADQIEPAIVNAIGGDSNSY